MKTLGSFFLLASLCSINLPAAPLKLSIGAANGAAELRLDRNPIAPVGGTRYRLLLESSADLKAWSAEGELIGDVSPAFSGSVTGPQRFFRLRPVIEDLGTNPDGAELFGYDRVFQEELRKVGFLTPENFAAAHDLTGRYLEAITFDPTAAKYWDGFNTDPLVFNAKLPPTSPDRQLYDLRLNPAELALFKTNGFVVSERLGAFSFAACFYKIFADDHPVFVSADAMLHAWHLSYQRLLEEAEELQLERALHEILFAMTGRLPELTPQARSGALAQSIQDVDYFLAVGRSLLADRPQLPIFGGAANVRRTFDKIKALAYDPDFEMFGASRPFDFSQFKPRGHYDKSELLRRYFRTFMWTARADFRIFCPSSNGMPNAQSLRELGATLVLAHLLKAGAVADRWKELDDFIRLFVGRTDAMTFAQLQPLLDASGINSLDEITSEDLFKLQQQVVQGDLGLQLIPGDVYFSPFSREQTQLPRSFVLTGQRFNPDGWSLGQVTFDRIKWNVEIPGATFFQKIIRRYPSALDVAFSVLGNREAGPNIAQRMLDPNGLKFRDGLPYAHNLTALAATFDRLPDSAWEDNIYTRWLAALRELSPPTSGSEFPEAMRTRAWAMRRLNTQLASYTELKHDTVLYAKQPYTSAITCDYPAGFVEPIPAFWEKMESMADALADGMEALPAAGVLIVEINPYEIPLWGSAVRVDLSARKAARINFCRQFAKHMGILAELARKELHQQPFTTEETAFIKGLMNDQAHPYTGPTYDGWYAKLFYRDYSQLFLAGGPESTAANKQDSLVTDIHTAPPDQVDAAGGVLHEATGNVDLLMIAVDSGTDRMVYAGPTLSHYEFIVPGPTLKRLTDSEWSSYGKPRPDWTKSYLVPAK